MSKIKLIGDYATQVDIGKVRKTNEDRTLAVLNAYDNLLMVVCDGMGGENKGDFAASLAIQTFNELFLAHKSFNTVGSMSRFLKKCLKVSNKLVYKESKDRPDFKGMGTCVSAVLLNSKNFVVAQIGDSRVYRYNQNGLEQLTEDQTLGMRQLRRGHITAEELKTYKDRHVLTNALGIHAVCAYDMKSFAYCGDNILVCSDGLYNNVSDVELNNILRGKDSPSQKINELMNLANYNGGSDNIAAIIWESKK